MTITTDPAARSASPVAAARARHTTTILAIILISYFMILLDNSITFTALPKIHAAMRFSPAGLAWVQDAYTLVFGGCCCSGQGRVTCWAVAGCSSSGSRSSRWRRC